MAVSVDMFRAVAMAMQMKMHAVAPQPPKHIGAETNQHDADGGFKRLGQLLGNYLTQYDCRAGEDGKRQRVAEPPCQAMLDDIDDIGLPGSNAGHRRNMVGLQRVLHP